MAAGIMGRPTKLTQALKEACIDYLNGGYVNDEQVIPSHVGMCKVVGISRSTLYNWADEDDDILDITECCNELQENALLNGGLRGTFNATICKLIMGKHGYHEKSEVGLGEIEDLNIKVTYE